MTRIRDRILVTLLAIVLVMIGPTVYALMTLQHLNHVAAELRTSNDLPVSAARKRLEECETLADLHDATGDPDYRRVAAQCAEGLREDAMALAEALGERTTATVPALVDAVECYSRMARDTSSPDAVAQREGCRARLDATLRDIASAEADYRARLTADAEQFSHTALHVVWVAVVAALLMAMVLASLLARRIVRPLRQLLAATRQVARGQFDTEVPVATEDEIGGLTREFNRMNRELAALDRLKAEFLSVASHELRSPVASLTGYLDLLRSEGDSLPPGERRRIIGLLQEEADLLVRYINQFMDMSRLETGRLVFDPRWLPVRSFFESEVEGHGYTARGRGITIHAEVEGDLPVRFRADPDRLTEVVRNLLENALRHTPAGGTVTVRLRAGPDECLEFAVEDTGPGIPADELEQVFEKYYRGSRAQAGTGSGLGLAISRAIVEAHGGRLWAESPAGGGARLVCRLPVKGPADAAPPAR